MKTAGFAALAAVGALAQALIVTDASARPIRIDLPGAGNYDTKGEFWIGGTTGIDPAAPDPVSVTLPFQINYGGGGVSAACLSVDGVVWFASDCSAGRAANAYIAVFDRALVPVEEPTQANSVTGTYTEGFIATTTPFPALPDNPETTLPHNTARFTWFGLTQADPAANPALQIYAQLILIDQGGGNFDMEVNYGNTVGPDPLYKAGEGGITAGAPLLSFVLGGNSFSYNEGLSRSFDPFIFANGAFTGGPSVTPPVTGVPEPASFALVLCGLTGVGAMVRRRRVRATA